MAVAHRLAHGDEIGHEAVAGKAPHLFAAAAEAGLHLVGDEQRAFCPDGFDRGAQKAGRVGEHAVAGKDGVDQKRRRPDAALLHVVQRVADVTGKDLAGVSRPNPAPAPAARGFLPEAEVRARETAQPARW